MERVTASAALALAVLLIAATGIWATLALAVAGPKFDGLRYLPAATIAAMSLGALAALRFRAWRWRACAVHAALFSAVLAWYAGIEPSNDRDWQADAAKLPYAEVEGGAVTIRNIRNFDYRSETDYVPAWYDKRFELAALQGVDLVAVYWMGPAIAHVFLSFAFAGGEHLAVSIETRKETGEAYSTVRGFFRQYELFYVVADERDVIRLRTNYRRDPPEEVYVYRAEGSLEGARRLFLEYVARINALRAQPEFYNTLTTNCTTTTWLNARVNPERLPFSWKILASGYLPEYLYEKGRLATEGLPFAELRRRALVNVRAQAADGALDFSRLIRSAR